ncbi:DapH/DapD/GlmU-related protein [Sinomonas albida]|uniref:DapH/DapD/GlmU-related protein n=1 Tax=Sinomonas albida TaxID=369942 RepID=UPI0010A814E0
MKNKMSRLFRHETNIHAFRALVSRGTSGLAAAVNARLLGWKDSRLPLGSRVIGSKYIDVSPGFHSAGPVWIEAIFEYEGDLYNPSIRIGKNFRGSGQLHLSAINTIEIGDDCLFGTNVFISDHGHGSYNGDGIQSSPHIPPISRPLRGHGGVKVGNRCWVGNNVVIAQGLAIGDGSILAANSVVTRDVPPESIVAGAPARIIRTYSMGTRAWMAHSVDAAYSRPTTGSQRQPSAQGEDS